MARPLAYTGFMNETSPKPPFAVTDHAFTERGYLTLAVTSSRGVIYRITLSPRGAWSHPDSNAGPASVNQAFAIRECVIRWMFSVVREHAAWANAMDGKQP